jgi:transcription initiation factor TFIIH subunit 2
MASKGKRKVNDEQYMNIDDDAQADNEQSSYAWEEEYKRSWDVIQEDKDGSLRRFVENFSRMKRKR